MLDPSLVPESPVDRALEAGKRFVRHAEQGIRARDVVQHCRIFGVDRERAADVFDGAVAIAGLRFVVAVDEVRVGDRRMALAVPATYMNESGQAVGPLVRRFGVEPDHLVVVHDELDLPPAELRVKLGGGLAGHNGLRSIKQHVHSDGFARVRIGVGKPQSKEHGADHVLSGFSKRDREQSAVTLEEAADAVELILTDGVEAAMNRYNGRAGGGRDDR